MANPKLGKKSDLIAERFELVQFLGSGGQGEVWKASDTVDNNATIAVKLYPTTSQKREIDEVQALTKIQNKNIVSFIDADVSSVKTHYLAMEYAKHKTLDKHDYFRGDIALSTDLFCRICDGVSSIHEADYIHRDLKPSNILVCDDQRDLKVGDFGLCFPPIGTNRKRTPARENVGPIFFSAPEQTSNPPTPSKKSDIYSLGRIFHWMITGVYEHAPTDNYRPVSTILGMDEQLQIDSLIKSMVSLAPSDRPDSVESILDSLREDKVKPIKLEEVRLSADQRMLLSFIETEGGSSHLESLVEHMAIIEGVKRPQPYEEFLSPLNGNRWKSTATTTLNKLRQMVKYGVIYQSGNSYYQEEEDDD